MQNAHVNTFSQLVCEQNSHDSQRFKLNIAFENKFMAIQFHSSNGRVFSTERMIINLNFGGFVN